MAEFKNYTLGQDGVDVDTTPLKASPNSLTKAQNAIMDPLGSGGALKKRPGLTKHNSGAFAGSALGGISVPLASFVDTRTLYLAQIDGSSNKNWYTSSDMFATSGVQNSSIAAWQDPTAYFSGGAGLCRMGSFSDGKLFYASSDYTSGTTSPHIRMYNGSEDREFSVILPATTKGVTGIHVVKGTIYILTLDSGTTDADFVGRVFSMDSKNGQLTQIGNALTTGHVPVSLAVYNGKVFVGTARVTTSNSAVVLSINPITGSSWATDFTAAANDYAITSLTSFKGLLYGTTKNGGAGTKGKILQRSLAGSWTTVDSTVNNSGTYDGSAVFGGALYVSSRSYSTTTNTAVIRKSTDGSAWSTVTNATATDGFGLMTVIGLRLFSQFGTKIQHTTDGTTWTLRTPGAGGNVDGALGILISSGAPSFSNPNTTPSGLGTDSSQTGTTTTTTTTTSVSLTQLQSVLGSQMIQVATITITDAQWRAMGANGAPQTIVAAPGTGKSILPWKFALACTTLGTFSSDLSLRLQYNGQTTNLLQSTIAPGTNAIIGKIRAHQLGEQSNNGAYPAGAENGALEVSSGSAVPVGGSTSAGFLLTVWYSVLTIN